MRHSSPVVISLQDLSYRMLQKHLFLYNIKKVERSVLIQTCMCQCICGGRYYQEEMIILYSIKAALLVGVQSYNTK